MASSFSPHFLNRGLSRALRIVLVAAMLGACAEAPTYAPAGAPQTVTATPPRIGDAWDYTVRDAYTGAPRGLYRYVVVRVDAATTVVDVYRDGQRVDAHVYAQGWNPLEAPITNLQRFRFDPPFPAFEYPLHAGQTWYTIVNATAPGTQKSYRMHIQARVTGWERLHVAAGDFDALKIVRYVYAGNAEWFNTQEEIVQTDWYAPAVNHVIRSEGRSSHIDTSRAGGGRGRPLVVRGEWLVSELTAYTLH